MSEQELCLNNFRESILKDSEKMRHWRMMFCWEESKWQRKICIHPASSVCYDVGICPPIKTYLLINEGSPLEALFISSWTEPFRKQLSGRNTDCPFDTNIVEQIGKPDITTLVADSKVHSTRNDGK